VANPFWQLSNFEWSVMSTWRLFVNGCHLPRIRCLRSSIIGEKVVLINHGVRMLFRCYLGGRIAKPPPSAARLCSSGHGPRQEQTGMNAKTSGAVILDGQSSI
jgi:hypothetical protein